MAYLGNAPARSFISFERQVFTIVNSQTAYTLDHSVNNENDIRLVVNNVVQEPGSGKAYTASGTTLTLSAALVNGTDEMYCVFLGRATATNAPGAGSVGATQLASDAVTAAKLNDDIISGQTALGEAPADTDEFLVSDAGTLKRVDYSYIKGLSNWSESSGNLLPSNASYGIYLGVNSATAANLLDDYEEGTWTPTFVDQNNTQATSYTNSSSASYTKIGNICYVMMDIDFGSIDNSNMSIYAGIGGYPFTCINAQSSMTGQLALYQTEFGTEEFATVIEHNKANGIFYHNGSTVSPGTIGTSLRAFFNFAYKTA
jgi:hypothetical protein